MYTHHAQTLKNNNNNNVIILIPMFTRYIHYNNMYIV